jgi:hypothetical protein
MASRSQSPFMRAGSGLDSPAWSRSWSIGGRSWPSRCAQAQDAAAAGRAGRANRAGPPPARVERAFARRREGQASRLDAASRQPRPPQLWDVPSGVVPHDSEPVRIADEPVVSATRRGRPHPDRPLRPCARVSRLPGRTTSPTLPARINAAGPPSPTRSTRGSHRLRTLSGDDSHSRHGRLKGLLGEVNDLAGDGQHLIFGLVAAAPQLGTDPVRSLSGQRGRVVEAGTGRHAGGLDPGHQPGGLGDAPHQQPRIRRVLDVGRHDGRVRPQPPDVDHARLDRRGHQPGVQVLDELGPAPRGDLHQRRRMRRRLTDQDPAEPPPTQRVRYLGAQRLVSEPVAVLQERSTASSSVGITNASGGSGASHKVGLLRTVRSTGLMAPILRSQLRSRSHHPEPA